MSYIMLSIHQYKEQYDEFFFGETMIQMRSAIEQLGHLFLKVLSILRLLAFLHEIVFKFHCLCESKQCPLTFRWCIIYILVGEVGHSQEVHILLIKVVVMGVIFVVVDIKNWLLVGDIFVLVRGDEYNSMMTHKWIEIGEYIMRMLGGLGRWGMCFVLHGRHLMNAFQFGDVVKPINEVGVVTLKPWTKQHVFTK